MKLVMVHGRSQGGKDKVALKKEWLDALTYGLARASLILPADTTIELPYYGDMLDSLVAQVGTPLGSDVLARGTDSDGEEAFRGEMIEEFALAMGLTLRDIERELGNAPIRRGPLNWEWVQAILRAVDRVPGINSKAIDVFTRDVFVYLTFPGARRRIDAVVKEAIGAEPCVVLAHSLGTIVAYNVLCSRHAEPTLPRFVTVGSPLGVNAIKQRLDKPLRVPPGVANWFNAYDDRDVVAIVSLDQTSFPVAPPIDNKSDVVNFTDNRHGIAGYLADPTVAKKIVELLT